MGTKIQANTYLREYHSPIELDASTSNALKEKWILENGNAMNEKVRQTILEHESTFRNQLRELHRLHGRQQELMNEIKRRGINKDDAMEDKFQLSYLFSPFPTENAKWQDKRSFSSYEPRVLNSSSLSGGNYNLGFPAESYFSMEKRVQENVSKFPIVESTSEKWNHGTACDRADKLSLSAVQTSQLGADALTFSLYNRCHYPQEMSMSKAADGVSANSGSVLNLVTKDFFHDSRDRMNKEGPLSILGLRKERSGNEHPSDDYADKRRIDKHASVGDLFSGKSLAFPQSLLSEPRKEHSNCPLDIGTWLSRKKKKIFGVEISEGSDDAYGLASHMSINHVHVPTLESSSSSLADSFVQNLKLHIANRDDGKNERSNADSKGEILSQKRSSCHSGMNGTWLEGDFKTYFKNVDNTNKAADVLTKDPEHSQKPRELADCQSNQENPKGSLPWFLRNARVSADLSNATKSPYFMNLDSLQNCSHKFFRKAEMPHITVQNSKQKKEAEINEDQKILVEVDENGSRNHLGTKDFVLDKGLNNCMSDLRHCIDLNLSVYEEDASSAPSLPSAILKIATKEIDLEAPAIIDDASPQELDSSKPNMLSGNTGLPYQERDQIAAEAMIAISLCVEKELVDEFNSLKWFAEVISSIGNDNTIAAAAAAAVDDDGSLLDGMDYFEFMTLKLEDTKEQHYCAEPFEETGAALTKRTRRGQSRRGRQRRDFQRDILPGLVTLSRLEVIEDFQAFEEMLRAGDSTWQSGVSHRRGRKHSGGGGATLLETTKTPCLTEAQQPVCQIEQRSLAGWGKKTRRLPRQRCPNAFLSFPVKMKC